MNPKEVSYSHPQLPLCDTPSCVVSCRLREAFSHLFRYCQSNRLVNGVAKLGVSG